MKVLISGGSGLVGRAISAQLLAKSHQVAILSRSGNSSMPGVEAFAWSPSQASMDKAALEGVDAIINLAGSSIAQRWTQHGKQSILKSRIDATRTIAKALAENEHQVEIVINASAVGYYPNSLEAEYSEEAAAGDDFLSEVCQKWEEEAIKIEGLTERVIRMRIGIVLDTQEGALAKMAQPIRFGIGAPLGSGKQWMPWIHKDDLASQFLFVLENKSLESGAFNAVGPYSVSNEELTQALAKTLKRPLILPNVPEFALKLLLGEMAATALASTKAINHKFKEYGFEYRYNRLEEALHALYVD